MFERQIFAVVDVETTGLAPERGDRIIELGVIRFTRDAIAESFGSLVHPGRPIPAESTRVHGITDAMVAGAPAFEAVAPKLASMVEGAILVAQNALFDDGFLRAECARAGVELRHVGLVDTIALAKAYANPDGGYNLDALADFYGVAKVDRHRSLGDCEVTRQVFLKALDEMVRFRKIKSPGDLLLLGRPKP